LEEKFQRFCFVHCFFSEDGKCNAMLGVRPIEMSKRNKTKTKNFGRKKHGNSQSERK
jgi:hypothetical protein